MEAQAITSMYANEDRHWWFVGRRRILDRLIQKLVPLPSGARILEAGCGTGGNLTLLRRFGKLEAFEFDRNARSLADSRAVAEVSYGRLPGDVRHDDAAFNLIALLDVLEHIDEAEESLATLRGKLVADGAILITVPAVPWLWSKHDEAHHHKRRYTSATLRKTLESAGLRAESIGYFNSLLFPLALAERMLSRLTGRNNDVDKTPPALLNAIFGQIFGFEAKLLPYLPFPIGLSLYAIARPQT